MFEKFISRYFSENSFLELANACFNEADIYFARNTEGGMKTLVSVCKDEQLATYLKVNREAMFQESREHDCGFIVAMPQAHQAFPAPYRVVVDQCMGEVTFLCGFERVFREREERKTKLTERERDELTAVIKILACASRSGVDWGSEDSLKEFLSSKDACCCIGYDIIQYFRLYDLGLTGAYLKAFLNCIPLLKEERIREVVKRRSETSSDEK